VGHGAIQYLEGRADALPEDQRPDPYWADDVVAGIIASVRAVIGVDELAARNAPPPEADTTGDQKQDLSP
jgi:hypothetical protein